MELIRYRKTLDVHKNGTQFTLQGFETADNLSRVIEISLMASGDAVDFPLEGLTAMMYVTTPSAAEPSVNACAIKDNKVMYEALPIVEAGITEMQLKLIETSIEGARRVLCSPKFAIEVSASGVTDDGAEQTTTFTALEDAVARANAVYDRRITGVDVDSECIFRVYYADGTVYETDALRRLILNENTDIDLDSMIKDGIISITADEVAESLGERYKPLFDNLQNTTNEHSVILEELQETAEKVEPLPEKVDTLDAEVKSNTERIADMEWISLGTVTHTVESTESDLSKTLTLGVNGMLSHKLSEARYIIKKGSTFHGKLDRRASTLTSADSVVSVIISNSVGDLFSYKLSSNENVLTEDSVTLSEDIIVSCRNTGHPTEVYSILNGTVDCSQLSVPQDYNSIVCKTDIVQANSKCVVSGGFSATIELQVKLK